MGKIWANVKLTLQSERGPCSSQAARTSHAGGLAPPHGAKSLRTQVLGRL